MNIYRNNQGFLIIEDILNGEYKSMSYLYYTKQEAIKKFKTQYSKNLYKKLDMIEKNKNYEIYRDKIFKQEAIKNFKKHYKKYYHKNGHKKKFNSKLNY